jgi:hypothetical protein
VILGDHQRPHGPDLNGSCKPCRAPTASSCPACPPETLARLDANELLDGQEADGNSATSGSFRNVAASGANCSPGSQRRSSMAATSVLATEAPLAASVWPNSS